MDTAALTPHERTLAESVSVEKMMESTTTIAQWVRLSGTPEEARAFDWLENRLREYGLETTLYHHPALVSWPESASLTATTAEDRSHEFACGGHSFAVSTPPEGLEGELVDAGSGSPEELREARVAGKIALVEGSASPESNPLMERAGVLGTLWINGPRDRGRILSPVWGTPTPETAGLLPKTPSATLRDAEGTRLKALLETGPLRVKLRTVVFRGWNSLPCLIGELKPAGEGAETDAFVLMSGHVDSWWHGAMDNGSANAGMLEVTRLLAERRSALKRGLRVAFWSGHSHGRYAGSAWYADNFWQDLHDRCVAHVNVDSLGATEATDLTMVDCMPILAALGATAVEQVSGQRMTPLRFSRAGDQSFWGHGIPAMFMSLSHQSTEDADLSRLVPHEKAGHKAKGGLGWWWHTSEDTLDKIDPDLLKRDATIYALVLHRLCTATFLPFDYRDAVAEEKANLAEIQARCGGHFDLSPVAGRLEALEKAVALLYNLAAEAQKAGDGERIAPLFNRCLRDLGHALIPADYTRTGLFDQDLAVSTAPFPALQPARELARMRPDSDEYQFLRTRLVRERNRVVHAAIEATRLVERALAEMVQPAC